MRPYVLSLVVLAGLGPTLLGCAVGYPVGAVPVPVQETYALDTYGTWQEVPSYGAVWAPQVAPGWRPYYYDDPWAFTYTSGTWIQASFGWGWVPSPGYGYYGGGYGYRGYGKKGYGYGKKGYGYGKKGYGYGKNGAGYGKNGYGGGYGSRYRGYGGRNDGGRYDGGRNDGGRYGGGSRGGGDSGAGSGRRDRDQGQWRSARPRRPDVDAGGTRPRGGARTVGSGFQRRPSVTLQGRAEPQGHGRAAAGRSGWAAPTRASHGGRGKSSPTPAVRGGGGHGAPTPVVRSGGSHGSATTARGRGQSSTARAGAPASGGRAVRSAGSFGRGASAFSPGH